ncbi:N-formylglutamate amidohydrolase [Steroidobacter agaridevorans]|uniref:N-formylglutamate amidohydrolase n=1 Tax=Steroidobacter agaridevorans TaxID=2695856 RepID=A0A829YER7_9GAMM|nr:N-formylglutamate amidohydrolase [Steroidobacter agaridevorans]GFE81759.1 N-formylglutamate amidohydrolase [Steroidobacter agaridevorans]
MLAQSATNDWPAAVEILNEHGRSPFVLICEHASNHIPAEYNKLGLDEKELIRHIAWDIGAAEVTRALSKRLDASAFLGGYSRLLIDLNRPLHVADSIPLRSEATDIPGNLSLEAAEKERRRRLMFHPFQDRLRTHLEERNADGRRNVLVAIHSFTPVYLGQQRVWHAGVLFDKAALMGQALIAQLSRDPLLNVGANVPYGVSADADYALVVYGDQLDNPAVLIEIRNDLIADPDGVGVWTRKLEDALRAVEQLS